MLAEGKSLDSRAVCKGAKGIITDGNLTGSDKVRRLQHILHAKACASGNHGNTRRRVGNLCISRMRICMTPTV